MANAAVEMLGRTRVQGGLVVSPAQVAAPFPLSSVIGQHPQPGAGSEEAGRRALAVARAVPAEAELIILISGGASALLAVPADGISLEDKRAATGVLLRAGADIYALNTVRKHLSAIKGGRLAAACPTKCDAYVLSDVVGNDLSVIASGPTVVDPSTYADALSVLEEFGGLDAYPESVVSHLRAGARGEQPESPKPGDPSLARATTTLIGGRHEAMHGAATEAVRRGYTVLAIDEPVVGDARIAGPQLARRVIDETASMSRPVCAIASGETTVRVVGRGTGGRNQELALAAAGALAASGLTMMLASVGTDGIDGPTDAAGALADPQTLERAARAGLAPAGAVLDDNNSYAYFDALGDLIRTGPTGTNVGDLQIFLLA
jgi:glycerate 2-kinase